MPVDQTMGWPETGPNVAPGRPHLSQSPYFPLPPLWPLRPLRFNSLFPCSLFSALSACSVVNLFFVQIRVNSWLKYLGVLAVSLLFLAHLANDNPFPFPYIPTAWIE